jgi:hypothetical protein
LGDPFSRSVYGGGVVSRVHSSAEDGASIPTRDASDWDATLHLFGGSDTGHGIRLIGDIYGDRMTKGHHPFRDGERVNTSPVISMRGDVFTTHTGTRYRIVFAAPPLGTSESE